MFGISPLSMHIFHIFRVGDCQMTVKSTHFRVEDKKIKPCKPYACKVLSNFWLRGEDSNLRPLGYEYFTYSHLHFQSFYLFTFLQPLYFFSYLFRILNLCYGAFSNISTNIYNKDFV